MSKDQDRLVEGALQAGLVTPEQVEEARGIQATVGEIGIDQSLSEILVKKGYLTEQQVRTIQREQAQKRIGKYEILDKLGVGGAGVVYRARHVTLGRIVALKVLSNRRASDPQYLDRFVREARIAVTLNHRNIVRGLDYGEADGYHYFVMEFVPGDTLYEVILREGRVEEARVLEIGIQVAKALLHALQYDLSHRDLKPDNILLSVDTNEAKVCDLGLAKPRKLETSGPQASSAAIGTPAYIAPEQIRGIDQADTRSDIYSLGATMFHAMCGRPPFEGATVEALLRAHLNEEPPDPRVIVVDLSSGTAAVLLKMLAKDPADRYQKLSDLIADLEAVLEGRPPVHTIAFARKGPAMAEGRSRSDLARHRAKPWKLFASLGLLLGVAVAAFLIWGGGSGGSGASVAPVPDGEETESAPVVVAPTRNLEREARAALAAAQGFWESNPGYWASAIERFEFVLREYEGTRFAIDAREGRDAVMAAWKARASEQWSELSADIKKLVERAEFGKALGVAGSFSKELRAADGFGDKVETRSKEIRQAARDALTRALAEAKRAAEDLRFADALAAMDPLIACGMKDIEGEAVAARSTIQTERDRVEGLLREGERAFRVFYGELLLAFGTDGYDAAFAKLSGARDREVFALVQERLEDAGLDLNRIAAFDEEVRKGYDRKQGETITVRMTDGRTATGRLENAGRDGLLIRRGGTSERVEWLEVAPDERIEAALESLGSMQTNSRLDATLWALAQGRLDIAAKQLDAAASLGGDVKPYEVRVANVRVARDARVEVWLREADVHLLEGRLPEARELLDRAVAAAPDHAHARYRRGVVNGKLRRTEPALQDLREAVRLGETEPRAHLEIARILEAAGQEAEALAAYDEFLKTSPSGDDAEEAVRRVGELRGRLDALRAKDLRATGDSAMRNRDWKGGLAALREADRLVPDDAKTVLGIAKASEKLGRIFDAYVAYRRYLDLRPSGSGPRDARKTIAELEAAYSNPKEALGDLGSGELAYSVGKYDEAIDCLDAGLEKAPLNATGYYNRAHSWYAKSVVSGVAAHARSAIDDFDRALTLKPGNGAALAGRALCWLQFRRYDECLEDAKKAIALLPEDYLSYNTAGLASFALERYIDAVDYHGRAIKLSSKSAILYVNRARAYWLMRKLDDALTDLRAAESVADDPAQAAEIRDMTRKIERQKAQGG